MSVNQSFCQKLDVSIPPSATGRLEVLRGLAALQVAGLHSFQAAEGAGCRTVGTAICATLFNGGAAVSLFFVLSGFLLGQCLARSNGTGVGLVTVFGFKRFFRIYPAFFVSAIIGIGLLSFYALVYEPTPSEYVNTFFPTQFSGREFVRNLCFRQFSLNRVAWTLQMELICSFLVPVMFLLERRARIMPWIALLASLVLGHMWNNSVVLVPAFLLGYLLPRYAGFFRRNRSKTSKSIFWIAALVLFLGPRQVFGFATAPAIEAIGAFAIIGAITYGNGEWSKVFDRKPVHYLGHVSYSYYLYHAYFLVAVAHILMRCFPNMSVCASPSVYGFVLLIVSSAIALVVAGFSYTKIEQPFISWSRKVARRWESRGSMQ